MRISDWSSDVCSSDLSHRLLPGVAPNRGHEKADDDSPNTPKQHLVSMPGKRIESSPQFGHAGESAEPKEQRDYRPGSSADEKETKFRSEEHTSALQSQMRHSSAVCCLKNKTHQ